MYTYVPTHLMQAWKNKHMGLQAVTRNELYGYVHPSTREWREGIISTTFRDMSNNKTNKHQWILLDGDIDAEWIEVCARPKMCWLIEGCTFEKAILYLAVVAISCCPLCCCHACAWGKQPFCETFK